MQEQLPRALLCKQGVGSSSLSAGTILDSSVGTPTCMSARRFCDEGRRGPG